MHPLPSARLKRRMNELERALIYTVIILTMLLVVLFLSGVLFQIDDLQPNQKFISVVPIRVARKLENEYDVFPYFLPGTLAWNRTETLHHCQVDHLFTSGGGGKRLPQTQGCSKSEKYRLIFHLTPKSGSSTGRHVVKHDFEGVDYHHDRDCRIPEGEENVWLSMAVLRNPATRAFASYEEMFVRKLGNPDAIPANTRRFMEPFRGWIYPNYSALFDTSDGVRKLNVAYEQFMEDWDGQAFEMHLESQVAYNVRRSAADGKTINANHLNLVFDTHAMEQSFAQVAAHVGLPHAPKVIRGRAYPRRLNVSQVSDTAMQAMCRHYKEDFCCLNYVLPPACLRAASLGRVRCKWDNNKIQAVIV